MGSLPADLQTAPAVSSRISTVVPATPRGEENGAYQLNYMDLLMKLHYIRPVYFFAAEAAQGLTAYDLKGPMFPLLDKYSHVSGRIRRSESGRPYIKCNDAGVRVAESHHDGTLREWFDENGCSVEGLAPDHVLGPDLAFSPLLFIKFTWFKCGGLSLGLSWAHVLGDAVSAFNFITKWSQILAGNPPPKCLHIPNLAEPQFPLKSLHEKPSSVKKTRIVGEYWLAANDNDVATHSFHITSKQLHHLVTGTNQTNDATTKAETKYFEIIAALVWKCIAQISDDSGPKVVTICTSDSDRAESDFPSNGLVLSKFEAPSGVGKSNVFELAKRIAEKRMVENNVMEKLVEEDGGGKDDFIVYGASLTFVNLEEADIRGVKINGHKPVMANCTFRGVGDQGVVMVLPAPEDGGGDHGRIVTVSLPEKELNQLKAKLEGELMAYN